MTAIELYELPGALVRALALEARQEEQPGEPSNGGSPGCQVWLRIRAVPQLEPIGVYARIGPSQGNSP
jgi:hypothetical protein